jgi:Flp pilus assembly protein RcpC/CpaB
VIATFDAEQFSQLQATTPTTVSAAVPTTAPPTSPASTSTTLGLTTTMNLGMVLSPAEVTRIKELTGLDRTQTVSNVSITILQQVEVLGMDILLPVTTQTEGGGGVLGGRDQSTTEDVPDSPVITLMVSPADAEKIVYAQTYGKITFTLIPAQDTTKVDATGHALPNLFR